MLALWLSFSQATLLLALWNPVQSPALLGDLHRMVPQEVGYTRSSAFGDLDGDGDVDIVCGSAPITVLENSGDGRFALRASLPPGAVYPDYASVVAVADIDGDGDLDILAGAPAQPDWVYRNDGLGAFGSPEVLHAGLQPNTGIAVGDLDGDGDVDVMLSQGYQTSTNQNVLLFNDGSGHFTDASATLPNSHLHQAMDVAFGDVDTDGDLDVVLANFTFHAGESELYLNDGSGHFTDASSQLGGISGFPLHVFLRDVDGDGDLDVFVHNQAWSNNLHLNNGSGHFTDASHLVATVPAGHGGAAMLDVEGDGDPDLLTQLWAEPTRLYRNDGTGRFGAPVSIAVQPQLGSAMAAADVDGDGDLDVWNSNNGQDHLLLGDGNGSFLDVTTSFPSTLDLAGFDRSRDIDLGDADGDGDVDAFFGRYSQNWLYRNDGTGIFSPSSASIPAGVTGISQLGDIDGDGDLDALVTDDGEKMLRNDGTGTFVEASMSSLPQSTIADTAALGDLDGDGDLDALLGTEFCYSLPPCSGIPQQVRLNDGFGTLTLAAGLAPHHPDVTSALALADLDLDGDLDAAVGNGSSWSYPGTFVNRVYINHGGGLLRDSVGALPITNSKTVGIVPGDVDGDGDVDLLIVNRENGSAPGSNRLLFNDGQARFSEVPGALPGGPGRGASLSDFDADGDLDILLATEIRTRFFQNDGAGMFVDASRLAPAHVGWSEAVAAGDVDGDGDIDAIVGGEEDRLYLNLSRHLAWRSLPRAGKSLVLDVYGPPNGTWSLSYSQGTGAGQTTACGAWRLAAPVVPAGQGTLDASGHASVDLPAGALPSQAGSTLYWQARVGPPCRYTNVEATTFVAY